MRLKTEVYDILKDGVENGIDDPGAFTYAVEAALTVIGRLVDFCEKHGSIALSCGGEWMYQSDEGQVDALELVANILDDLEDYAEDDGDFE